MDGKDHEYHNESLRYDPKFICLQKNEHFRKNAKNQRSSKIIQNHPKYIQDHQKSPSNPQNHQNAKIPKAQKSPSPKTQKSSTYENPQNPPKSTNQLLRSLENPYYELIPPLICAA